MVSNEATSNVSNIEKTTIFRILLHTAHWLIHFMWKRSIDPDNSAIPYLTSLGDLLGGGLLALAFELLEIIKST